jgi:hypothetical protein
MAVEAWNMTEGARSDVRGSWAVTLNNNQVIGRAMVTGPQGVITYHLMGFINGNTYNNFES